MIGRVGWAVQELVKGTHANPSGDLTRMEECTLPMVLEVTVFDYANAGTILIVHSQTAWDDRPTQTKCLIGSHLLQDGDVTVDDTTMRDRGK